MKIVHASQTEIAGQLALSAFGQNDIGHEAHVFCPPHPFGYAINPGSYLRTRSRWLTRLETAKNLPLFPLRYDVFHFHYGQSFLDEKWRFPDARAYRKLGKKVVVEFWGSEARIGSIESSRNPYYSPIDLEPEVCKRNRLQRWAEITSGHAIFVDHSFDAFLGPYFSDIHVVGQRIDLRAFAPAYPSPGKRRPVIVHAPSHKGFKGTRFLQTAINNLKVRGLSFEYIEVHGVRQAEAREIYAKADLIFDQLMLGSLGVFSVEAMALGKPVVCYILPELVGTFPEGFPIINANPDTIEMVLEDWIQRPEDRHRVGVESRQYAERTHDCRVVASKLIEVYNTLP